MRNKKLIIFIILILVAIAGVLFLSKIKVNKTKEAVKEIKPTFGSIENIISTTGTVLPKNRLEIKPPVNGRLEEILVKEGDFVKVGQILAWMSSTERAALLDAARGQGQEQLKYWKDVYKAIALIAPIDGEVIVATVQPGQTITTSEAAIVLSDHLIVRAQVDETDIGKVNLGQDANVSLDAYPDIKIKAKVEHIYYESETVNNVTIYKVDLAPEGIPQFFRSGMNATIDFIAQKKDNIMLIPQEAVIKEGGGDFVLLKNPVSPGQAIKQPVKLGVYDDKNIEVISGINKDDTIVLKSVKYSLPKSNTGTNPFMPSRRR